jgi:mono/diheme cytochrome c family protein
MRRFLTFPAAVAAVGFCALAASTASNKNTVAPVSKPSDPAAFPRDVQPFLQKNCILCHNDKAKVGDLSLAPFHSAADVIQNRALWERISTRIKNGEMPPKGLPRPADSDIKLVSGWIDGTFDAIDRAAPPDPGRPTAHRLNRFEYNNAVDDLLDIDFKPAEDFPTDDAGYGFDNIGDVLSISPVLMEKYLTAAEKIARKAIPTGALPKPTRERISAAHVHKYPATPVGEYIRYKVANEADYTIRAGVSGDRVPLQVTLLVDNVPVKDMVFIPGTQPNDDENPRFIEYPVHLTLGKHRLGARLRRIVAVMPPPRALNLRFLDELAKKGDLDKNKQPPPPTPWVDYIELHGPYKPLPAPAPEAMKRIFICDDKTPECTAEIVRALAYRAWRRPVTDREVGKLASFVDVAKANGDDYQEGIRLALEAILVSPDFLFRIERDPNPHDAASPHPLSDYELASRLSFFLWSSIPDAELLHAAQEHTLHQPQVLRAELARLLKDGKSERFVDNFAGQWLELRNLDSIKPDPDKFPDFRDLRDDMRTETRMFFEAVLRDDRGILDFIDGRYSFLDEKLAAFYGIPNVKGSEFRRVNLDGAERSGVLTQASVLTVSSYPTRTSPVIRGKWVLENFLNAPPPPPPANVPSLESQGGLDKLSMREQLEKHRSNPVCASCHSKMDPLGFGLENYNAIGQWRTADGKFPIDPSGTLPTGQSFSGSQQMKEILKANPRAFAQCLTEKMLTYALGRGLERYDRPAVEKIVDRLQANDYKFSQLISGIIESLPFQERRGEGERHVTQTLAKASAP